MPHPLLFALAVWLLVSALILGLCIAAKGEPKTPDNHRK